MAKKTQAGTNVGKVKQQNAGGQFGTEFASETDVQQVKRQNQQSQNKAVPRYWDSNNENGRSMESAIRQKRLPLFRKIRST